MDSEAWKAWAAPANLPRMLAGSPMRRAAPSTALTASPRATPGARLNESVTDGKRPWWFTCSGAALGSKRVSAVSGTDSPRVRLDMDVAEGVGALPELGRHLHHHPVLVELGVDGGHLALAERAVERLVDEPRAHPEPGRGGPIDGERHLQPRVLLVARDVAAARGGRAGSGACAGPTRSGPPAGRPGACTGTARCPCARPPGCPAPPGDSRWRRPRGPASGAGG